MCPLLYTNTTIILDVFVDNSFVEIFVNEGEKSFSMRVFNTSNEENIITVNKKINLSTFNYRK